MNELPKIDTEKYKLRFGITPECIGQPPLRRKQVPWLLLWVVFLLTGVVFAVSGVILWRHSDKMQTMPSSSVVAEGPTQSSEITSAEQAEFDALTARVAKMQADKVKRVAHAHETLEALSIYDGKGFNSDERARVRETTVCLHVSGDGTNWLRLSETSRSLIAFTASSFLGPSLDPIPQLHLVHYLVDFTDAFYAEATPKMRELNTIQDVMKIGNQSFIADGSPDFDAQGRAITE